MNPNKLTRRDFMKTTALGLAGPPIVQAIERLFPDRRAQMIGKILSNLSESKRPSEQDSKAGETAFTWIFAETASTLASKYGYPDAGDNLRHYLYGNGATLDYSPQLSKRMLNPSFWNTLITSSLSDTLYKYFPKTADFDETKMLDIVRVLRQSWMTGATFTSDLFDSNNTDQYLALGSSTFEIRADSVTQKKKEDGIEISITNPKVRLTDFYDWKSTETQPLKPWLEGAIDHQAHNVFSELDSTMMEMQNTISDPKTRDVFLKLYQDNRSRLIELSSRWLSLLAQGSYSKVTGAPFNSSNAQELVVDITLLEAVGAKPYPITGYHQRKGVINSLIQI